MKGKPLSPLRLAILALLFERPMHPYEMAATLKARGKEESIKLRYGSLYTAVESLVRDALIAPKETVRDGRRPERTVFTITGEGSDRLESALADLLARPEKEYPQFEAALSLMPVLPPEQVLSLLKKRMFALTTALAALTAGIAEAERQGLPALFLVETAYRRAALEAEHRFVGTLIADIESGTLSGIAQWQDFHAKHANKAE